MLGVNPQRWAIEVRPRAIAVPRPNRISCGVTRPARSRTRSHAVDRRRHAAPPSAGRARSRTQSHHPTQHPSKFRQRQSDLMRIQMLDAVRRPYRIGAGVRDRRQVGQIGEDIGLDGEDRRQRAAAASCRSSVAACLHCVDHPTLTRTRSRCGPVTDGAWFAAGSDAHYGSEQDPSAPAACRFSGPQASRFFA